MSGSNKRAQKFPDGNGYWHNQAKEIELNTEIVTRFWVTIADLRDSTDCWIWPRRKDQDGYGLIRSGEGRGGSAYTKAHRLSWVIHNGAVPQGILICHSCDQPPCVNPKHLFLGTNLDNIADARAKGRMKDPKEFLLGFWNKPRTGKVGATHPSAKLSPQDVLIIVEHHHQLVGDGLSHNGASKVLAEQYGVSRQTIWNIMSGRKWSEVTGIGWGV